MVKITFYTYRSRAFVQVHFDEALLLAILTGKWFYNIFVLNISKLVYIL